MGAGSIVFNVILGLLVLAAVACLAYGGYTLYQQSNIQVGAIVQMQFVGNPAFLTSALIGPRGELESEATPQDLLGIAYCDVPGSAGAYSSWFRPAGNNAPYNPYIQSSYTTHWSNSWSCNVNADCASMPWLQCGSVGNCWPSGSFSKDHPGGVWSEQQAAACCGGVGKDSDKLVCSMTSPDGETTGHCVASANTDNPDGSDLFVCNTATHRCIAGATSFPAGMQFCKDWGTSECSAVPGGACNVAAGGVCQPDYGEHVMLNTPWLAEGVVSSVNSDGSVNVAWSRVKNLYANAGPSLPWFPQNTPAWDYGNCVFIAGSDPANSVSAGNVANTRVVAAALGLGSLGTDVAGLPTASSDPASPFNAVDPTLGYGWMGATQPSQTISGLPILSQVGGSASAWNLTATSISTSSLKRVPAYTIAPPAATPWNATLAASLSSFRTLYNPDRPPHLQLPPQVYYAGPTSAGTFTQADAISMATELGGVLATKAQLEAAQAAGAQWCVGGWVADDDTQGYYPMQYAVPGWCSYTPGTLSSVGATQTGGAVVYGIKPAKSAPRPAGVWIDGWFDSWSTATKPPSIVSSVWDAPSV